MLRLLAKFSRHTSHALVIDVLMLICFMLGLAYHFTGNMLHEINGLIFLALCLIHNIYNWKWYTRIFKIKHGVRQKLGRIINLMLVFVLLSFIASSIFQSQDIFTFFHENQSLTTRKIHTTLAYWFLIILGLHIGLHGKMLLAILHQKLNRPYSAFKISQRIFAIFIISYGLYAFKVHNMPDKLLGLVSFEFWNYETAYLSFFANYAALLMFEICITHYAVQTWEKHGLKIFHITFFLRGLFK